MEAETGPDERKPGAAPGRTLAFSSAVLSVLYLAGALLVWTLAVRDTGIWIGTGVGLAGAWIKTLHLMWWLRDPDRKIQPGMAGLLVSIAAFASSAMLASMHSRTALAACLSTFAMPYISVIMVSLKGRPG